MDKLRDPWIFSGAAGLLIAAVTYVWGQVTDPGTNSVRPAAKAAVVAIFSLLLLTWLAHGHKNSGPMLEPFPTE